MFLILLRLRFGFVGHEDDLWHPSFHAAGLVGRFSVVAREIVAKNWVNFAGGLELGGASSDPETVL